MGENMKRRVVITGLGAVSPLGNSVDELWQGVCEGKSGVGNITLFDASNYDIQIAAEVKNLDPTQWIDRKEVRKMGRFTMFAACAAIQAFNDAGLSKDTVDPWRTGVLVGNGIGGFEIMENSMNKYFSAGANRIPPLTVPQMITNEAPANISMLLGLKSVSWTLATACASGTDALGAAVDLIRSGRMDICLSGGTEAPITGFGVGCFTVLKTLASSYNDAPEKASRPFDVAREGFIMGEGAGILVLEELEHAKKRGARIYAELAGYGASCDAYHITSPDPSGEGGAQAVLNALEDAGVAPESVQYYNAHGTSTPINDPTETTMLKKAFGDHAYKMKVSSTKSMTGHCLGAAGALEAIICVKTLTDGIIPPTINLDTLDIEHGCDLDYVPNKAVKMDVDCVASGSLGFGGHNGVVVLKKYEENQQ
jgi:3-oxoacyl-[acyl-carrier-protein] synthase II